MKGGNYYFEDATVTNTVALTQYLMNKYNVAADHVIMHFDVVGKDCPDPWIGVFGGDDSQWTKFKSRLSATTTNVNTTHFGYAFLQDLMSRKLITNEEYWSDFDSAVPKSYVAQVIDNAAGHWNSNEEDKSVHWCQPAVISLCGHGIITDKTFWLTNPDAPIAKSYMLAIIDKWTDGMKSEYADKNYDHWARRNLNSLCDKGIVTTPEAWTDFEAQVSKANFMAIVSKALKWF
jgi:hypothetical protein